jgi:hypothetical protein
VKLIAGGPTSLKYAWYTQDVNTEWVLRRRKEVVGAYLEVWIGLQVLVNMLHGYCSEIGTRWRYTLIHVVVMFLVVMSRFHIRSALVMSPRLAV